MTVLSPAYRADIYAPPSEQPGATDTELLAPRSGATHSDFCSIWTLPSDEARKGYLAPPTGLRSSLNLRDRKVTVGSLILRILDKKTGSGNAARWFSQFFSATSGEHRLLGCLVRLYEMLDGCSWDPYFVGRIFRVTKVSLLEYEIEVREVNENLDRPIFVGRPHSSVDYAELSTLMPWHLVNQYHNLPGHGPLPCTKLAASGAELCRIQLPVSAPMDQWCIMGTAIAERSTGLVSSVRQFGVYAYAKNNVRVRCTVGATTGEFWLRSVLCRADKYHSVAIQVSVEEVDAADPYYLPWASLGATGTAMDVTIFAVDMLRGQQGLIVDYVHPVRMMRDLVDGYFGLLNAAGDPTWSVPRDTSVGSIWDTLEADTSFPSASFIITRAAKEAPKRLNDWIEKHLCKPFGLAYTIDGSGNFTPVDVRRGAAVLSLPTLTDDDLVSDREGEGFERSMGTAITRVETSYYGDVELPQSTPSTDQAQWPDYPPALLKSVQHLKPVWASPQAVVDIGERSFEMDGQGLRYSPDFVSQSGTAYAEAMERVAEAVGLDFIALFSRGGHEVHLRCRRSAVPQSTNVGDRRFLELSGILNTESLLYGDGTILGRCIARAEEDGQIRLSFLIEAVSDQALPPTLGALTLGTPVALGQAVDQVVTPNAQGEAVELWIAITDTATAVIPAETDGRWQLIWQGINTAGTYTLSPLPENARIWVRGRTTPAYYGGTKQPSDWAYPTAPGYVDTTPGTPITGVTASNITGTTADITWSGGADNVLARVYRRLGSSTLGPWFTSELVNESLQPPRRYVTFGMAPSTQYTVAVIALDPVHGAFNLVGTVTFTTTASVSQCPRPAGITTVPGTSILLRVFSADISLDIEVERAPDSGGSPDLLSSVTFVIPRSGDYLDPLPSDKSVWWYRARHIATSAGLTPSDWTGWVSGVADTKWIGAPPTTDPDDPTLDPGRPAPGNPVLAPALPTFDVSQNSSAGVGTAVLTVTDPQLRVTLVEFQTFDGTTTSAWTPDATVPYMTTVPYTHQAQSIIRWRVTGYDASGQLGTLGSGEVYFGGTDEANLEMVLAGKAPLSHLHNLDEVVGLRTALAGAGGGGSTDILATRVFGP
jgi:hypothetical protein